MENKTGKLLIEVEYQEGKGEKCFYELLRLMNKDIPIAEGVTISKVYINGFGTEKIIETVRRNVNEMLDNMKLGL